MNISFKARMAEFGYKALVIALLGLWLVYPPQKSETLSVQTVTKSHTLKP
jgi:hypothetical protein